MEIQNLSGALISAGHSFHEATIRRFDREGRNLKLSCERESSHGQTSKFAILFEDVSSLLVDEEEPEGLLMEAADGEGLSIAGDPTGSQILIEWNDWDKRASWTRHYTVISKAIHVIPE